MIIDCFFSLFIFFPYKWGLLGIRLLSSLTPNLHWGSLSLVGQSSETTIMGCPGLPVPTLRHSLSCQVRVKILASLVTQFDSGLKAEVLSFILEDVRARLDLAFAWLYQEYNAYLAAGASGTLDKYEDCLIRLLSGLQEKPDQKDG